MKRAGLLFVALLVFAAVGLNATQVLYRTPQQLGAESELVVQGRVSSVQSYWNDTHTKIFTEATVSVAETFKGQGAGVVRVVQLGGTVGHVRMNVHGALQWSSGEEVVLFLEPGAQGAYLVAGYTQGKFHVERDGLNGEAYITRPAVTDVELVGGADADVSVLSRQTNVTVTKFINDALKRQ